MRPALLLALALLLAALVDSAGQRSARADWHPAGAERTCKVPVAKKIPKGGEAGKPAPRTKRRARIDSGSPNDPRVIDEAHRLSEETGDLIVDLPDDAYPLLDGRSLPARATYHHPAMGDLDAARLKLFCLGWRTRNPVTVAAAHILAATIKAIESNDEKALMEAHRWARDLIRPDEGTRRSSVFIPIEDAQGRVIDGVSGGFDMFARALKICIEEARREGRSLGQYAGAAARSMIDSFPGVASLATAPLNVDHGKRIELREAVTSRIREALHRLGEKHARDPVEEAAEDIAERLLRQELIGSGKSEGETARLLKFLDKRSHRRSVS